MKINENYDNLPQLKHLVSRASSKSKWASEVRGTACNTLPCPHWPAASLHTTHSCTVHAPRTAALHASRGHRLRRRLRHATPLQPSRPFALAYGSRPATLLRPAAATLLFLAPPLLRSCPPLLVPPPLLRSSRAPARRSSSSLLTGDALAGHAADEPACIPSSKSSPRFVFAVADKR